MKNKICASTCGIALTLSLIFGGCSSKVSENNFNSSEAQTSSNQIEYATGTITNNIYESPYLNLKFTPPENCIFMPIESINLALQEKESTKNFTYEMLASSSLSTMLTVMTEKLTLQNMTTEQCLEDFKTRQKKQLEENGNSNISFTNTQTATIAGQEYLSIIINSNSANNVFAIEQHCFVRKSDENRSVIITLIHQESEEDALNLINAFTPLK